MASTKYKKNKRGEYEARIWDGTYNTDGSKHRKKLVSKKSSADLERRVSEFKREVEDSRSCSFSNVTFREYAKEWLSVSKASKEKKTQKTYQTVIENYLSFIHDTPITGIRQSHLQQAINHNLNHPRTCKDIKSTFSQIVRSAVRDRILPQRAEFDLLADISLPKYIKRKRRALTPLERRAMFNARLDDRKSAFLFILYYLGTRKGEALALSSSDFDFSAKTVSISNVLVFDGNAPTVKPYPKSERGIRNIPLPDPLISRIRAFVESADGFIFRTQNGSLMTDTAYRRMWDSIITSLNVATGWNPNAKKDKKPRPITDLTAHIFRHNYCTELCYQIPKISTKMIASLLGDDEKMVLEVYSHILAEKEDVAGAIRDAFKT